MSTTRNELNVGSSVSVRVLLSVAGSTLVHEVAYGWDDIAQFRAETKERKA